MTISSTSFRVECRLCSVTHQFNTCYMLAGVLRQIAVKRHNFLQKAPGCPNGSRRTPFLSGDPSGVDVLLISGGGSDDKEAPPLPPPAVILPAADSCF